MATFNKFFKFIFKLTNMASETIKINESSLYFNKILNCIESKCNLIYKLIDANNGYIKVYKK